MVFMLSDNYTPQLTRLLLIYIYFSTFLRNCTKHMHRINITIPISVKKNSCLVGGARISQPPHFATILHTHPPLRSQMHQQIQWVILVVATTHSILRLYLGL